MKLKNCQRVQNYNTTATYTNDIVINNRLVTILSHNLVYDRPAAVAGARFAYRLHADKCQSAPQAATGSGRRGANTFHSIVF